MTLIEDMKRILEKCVRKFAVFDSQRRQIKISDQIFSIILGYSPLYMEHVKQNIKKDNLSYYWKKFMQIKDIIKNFLNEVIGDRTLFKKKKQIDQIINKNFQIFTCESLLIAINDIKLELGIILKEQFIKTHGNAKTQIWDNAKAFFLSKKYKNSEEIDNKLSSILTYHLSDNMLSNLFGRSRKFITNIKVRMTNENHRDYKPDYLFSLEILDDFMTNIKSILGIKDAYECIKRIGRYWNKNPNLKRYIKQQVTIDKPHFFRDLTHDEVSIMERYREKNIKKFYWLGFFLGDASLYKKESTLKINLKKTDILVLKRFAKCIGFPVKRIEQGIAYRKWGGKMHGYEYARLRFSSKEFATDLINLDFLKFKSNRIGLPSCVKKQVKKAYIQAKEKNKKWYNIIYGKYFCSFLLGFIDADGSLQKSIIRESTYYSINITNANLKLLEKIKEYLNIENKICTHSDPEDEYYRMRDIKPTKKCYRLCIPPNIYKNSLMTIEELKKLSMQRKRIEEANN
ncbi:MAG: LAGLIDADG family homing endonuclease [Promethearchaeia archaeon]